MFLLRDGGARATVNGVATNVLPDSTTLTRVVPRADGGCAADDGAAAASGGDSGSPVPSHADAEAERARMAELATCCAAQVA